MFKKFKNKTGTSPTNSTSGSALAGLNFKNNAAKASSGGSFSAQGAAKSALQSVTWSTSLSPDRKGSRVDPNRAGVVFLDARLILAPPAEIGSLLGALGKLKLRPILVPSILKIVGTVLKAKGGTGVASDRQLVEKHIKAALEAARVPVEDVQGLDPALSFDWLDENRYALPDGAEESVWLAVVNAVDQTPGAVGADALAGRANMPQEAARQISDRLTISHEIETVTRNTHGPHLFLAADEVLASAAVKDAGGPNLVAKTFKCRNEIPVIGFKTSAEAEQLLVQLVEEANRAAQEAANSPPPAANVNLNPFAVGSPTGRPDQEAWRRVAADPCDPRAPATEYEDPMNVDPNQPGPEQHAALQAQAAAAAQERAQPQAIPNAQQQ